MPTYTTVPDKATGDTITEANWDTHIKDNLNGLILRPACRVKNSGAQSVAQGGATTLTFDQEDFDTDTMHSTSSNTSRITATTAGLYHFTAIIDFAFDADGYRRAYFKFNNTTNLETVVVNAVSATYETGLCLSMDYAMTAGQYMEVIVEHNAGGNLDVTAKFSAFWIGNAS